MTSSITGHLTDGPVTGRTASLDAGAHGHRMGKAPAPDWRKWRPLTPRQRRLILSAALWLPSMSLAVNTVPLRRITGFLGLRPSPDPIQGGWVDREAAVDTGRAVAAVAARTPWTSTCLAQALTGARLLRVRGLPVTVTLGMYRSGGRSSAHAWLEHGPVVVTGAAPPNTYVPVGRFIG